MELKDILKSIKKYKKQLIIGATIGFVIGALSFVVFPPSYLASGSFLITRTTQKQSSKYFTYEGYYGQQTALSYTNTAIALFRSIDAQRETLAKLGKTITPKELRKFKRKIKVTKAGPQLVTLTIKANTAKKATDNWNTFTQTTLEMAETANSQGDKNIQIVRMVKDPIITKAYRPVIIEVIGGALVGFTASLGYASLKEYLSKGKRKKK